MTIVTERTSVLHTPIDIGITLPRSDVATDSLPPHIVDLALAALNAGKYDVVRGLLEQAGTVSAAERRRRERQADLHEHLTLLRAEGYRAQLATRIERAEWSATGAASRCPDCWRLGLVAHVLRHPARGGTVVYACNGCGHWTEG